MKFNYFQVSFKYTFLITIIFIFIFPTFWLFTTSIKFEIDALQFPPIFFPERITIQNYIKVIDSENIFNYFTNSFSISILSTFFGVILGSMAAFSLSKYYLSFRIRQGLLIWILIIRIFPPIVTAIPYFVIMRNLKLTDTQLGLIITHTTFVLPFVIWLMLGFFQDLPKEIDQAAIIDGCSFKQRFFHISLPLTLPGLATTSIFTFIYSWTEFLYASMLTSRNAKTLPVVIAGFMSDKFLRWGEMTALASLMIVPVLIFAFWAQKYLISGLTFGAVKE